MCYSSTGFILHCIHPPVGGGGGEGVGGVGVYTFLLKLRLSTETRKIKKEGGEERGGRI